MLHSAFASALSFFTSRPFASTYTTANFTVSPAFAVISAGNSRAPATAFGLNSASAGIGGYFTSAGFAFASPRQRRSVRVLKYMRPFTAMGVPLVSVCTVLPLMFSLNAYSKTALAFGAFLPPSSSGMMSIFPFTSKM